MALPSLDNQSSTHFMKEEHHTLSLSPHLDPTNQLSLSLVCSPSSCGPIQMGSVLLFNPSRDIFRTLSKVQLSGNSKKVREDVFERMVQLFGLWNWKNVMRWFS